MRRWPGPPCRVEIVAQIVVGQGSGEVADRLLLPPVRDGHEVARQLEHQALLRADLDGPGCRGQPVEEIADLDPQRLGQLLSRPAEMRLMPFSYLWACW